MLLVLWSFYIRNNSFSLSQHQWQENVVVAEKVIYDYDNLDNIIVGSSLARRLNMDSLPHFYNLSMSGQSVFDGLNILRNKKKLPKNVFIETNVIFRCENSSFNEIISSPILGVLKENSSIFRSDKQPLAYLGDKIAKPFVSLFFHKIIYKIRDKVQFELELNQTNTNTEPQNIIFDKLLAMNIELYSKDIDTAEMNKRFYHLKKDVNFLESNNVNVFFFEMPVNPQLLQLKRSKYLRDRLRSEFPNNSFIPIPSNVKNYKTGDGLHLTNEESKFYTDYFKNEALSLVNKGNN